MKLISGNPHKAIIYWLLTGCLLIYMMIVIGCLTRLTHSGLSITDWSFMGSVPPLNENMWQQRFEKYQDSPEFKEINFNMTLAEFKPIFMWEYVHRMTGRFMMYVFAIGFVIFLIKKKIKRDMVPAFILLFIMGAMQAVIGWWMVKSGLRDQPAVSHYRLATHLLSAFTLFAFTFWFALKLIFAQTTAQVTEGKRLKSLSIIFFCILLVQIIYGAFTAGFTEGNNVKIRPGHIYNTWPKMGVDWMPDTVTMYDGFWTNVLENPSGIQFVHRMGALVVVIMICILWYRSNKMQLNTYLHKAITWLIYGVTLQFILGVLTLIYNVPVILGALHQTGAFFLFAVSIYLMFHLFHKPTTQLERDL